MAMDYDTWLQSGPGGPFDDSAPGGDIDFTMKLRGGTVRVYASGHMESERDPDGYSSYMMVKIERVHWTFDPYGEIELTKDDLETVTESAKDILMDV